MSEQPRGRLVVVDDDGNIIDDAPQTQPEQPTQPQNIAEVEIPKNTGKFNLNFKDFYDEARKLEKETGYATEPLSFIIPEDMSGTGRDEIFEIKPPTAGQLATISTLNQEDFVSILAVLFIKEPNKPSGEPDTSDYERFLVCMDHMPVPVFMVFMEKFVAWWAPSAANMPPTLPKSVKSIPYARNLVQNYT